MFAKSWTRMFHQYLFLLGRFVTITVIVFVIVVIPKRPWGSPYPAPKAFWRAQLLKLPSQLVSCT
jgi:hypothetical protein